MEDDDVMLLDTYDSIFLWVGQKANSKEKQEAMKTAVVSDNFFNVMFNKFASSLFWLVKARREGATTLKCYETLIGKQNHSKFCVLEIQSLAQSLVPPESLRIAYLK